MRARIRRYLVGLIADGIREADRRRSAARMDAFGFPRGCAMDDFSDLPDPMKSQS